MIKTFDCVEMKDKAGKKISQKLSKMTTTQQLSYWENRQGKLIELREHLRKQAHGVSKSKRK